MPAARRWPSRATTRGDPGRRRQRAVRHAWLTDQIRAVHAASRGTYGARRVHAELTLGLGLQVGHNQVEMLMARAAIKGLPGNRRPRPRHETPTASDLVERMFTREAAKPVVGHRHHRAPHLRGQGVLRGRAGHLLPPGGRLVDRLQPDRGAGHQRPRAWPSPTATRSRAGSIHSDHGMQFTSWAFTDRAKRSGLVPSMGSIGDCYDNALIESFWGRMQTELLNRKRWKTRIELANAIFDYLEIFHNRQRRHSALGMRTPIEFELLHQSAQPVA